MQPFRLSGKIALQCVQGEAGIQVRRVKPHLSEAEKQSSRNVDAHQILPVAETVQVPR